MHDAIRLQDMIFAILNIPIRLLIIDQNMQILRAAAANAEWLQACSRWKYGLSGTFQVLILSYPW